MVGRIIPPQGIPILTYHSVDSNGSVISVSKEIFRDQISCLADQGYKTISLKTFIESLKNGSRQNKREVVLTFDDGYRNNYTSVFPILKKHDFTATIFLPTGFIGKTAKWGEKSSISKMPLLSWEEIKEMSEANMDFGAHTINHIDLTSASEIRMKEEIAGSKKIIEDSLGKPVDFFCYPYGKTSPKVEAIVRNLGFSGGCSIRYGIKNTIQDQYCLKRIGTARFSTHLDFVAGVLGTYGIYAGFSDFYKMITKRNHLNRLTYSN